MTDVEVFADPDVTVTADATGNVDVVGLANEVEIIEVPEQGPMGPQGVKGDHGTTLLVGDGPPSNGQGVDGDSYWDKTNKTIYGPKSAGVWPSSVLLVGPQGPQGNQGNQGIQGIQGPTGNTGNYYKNYVFNSAMALSLQNAGAAGSTNLYYAVEGFIHVFSHAGATTVQRIAALTPGGSPYRLRLTVGTAVASPATGNYDIVEHVIEGIDAADLKIGTANAKQVTVQFGVKAPAGTYYLALINGAQDRTFLGSYTITGGEANTDVQKSVTLTLATAGTWLNTEGTVGLRLVWTMMAGSTFQASAGTWLNAQAFTATGYFNVLGSVSNVFELFDVSLTVGAVAPAYLVPDIHSTYEKCLRYFESSPFNFNAVASSVTTGRGYSWMMPYKVTKAINPVSATVSGAATTRAATPTVSAGNTQAIRVLTTATNADGDDFAISGTWSVDSRLI